MYCGHLVLVTTVGGRVLWTCSACPEGQGCDARSGRCMTSSSRVRPSAAEVDDLVDLVQLAVEGRSA